MFDALERARGVGLSSLVAADFSATGGSHTQATERLGGWGPYHLAAFLCACLVLSHSLTVAYICWRDLRGDWEQYALIKNREPSLQLYLRGYMKFVFDMLFMLFPATWDPDLGLRRMGTVS